eukprot:TRINITY_DN13441_c0_g1_i1.p1 TRINITY_DN13441_c0_g1~~TRINITY_DN13441_c0_g1_i1.p1  ORF type:complete len:413 (+),score=156.78 TRINITY_DN13441_c0_g1_i1:61-1299(+)
MLRRTLQRACTTPFAPAASFPFKGWTDARCVEELNGKTSSEEVHQLFLRLRGGGGDVELGTYKATLKKLSALKGNEVVEKFHDVYNTLLMEEAGTGIKADEEVFTIAIGFWASILTLYKYMASEAGFCMRMVLAHMAASNFPITSTHASTVLKVAAASHDEALADKCWDIIEACPDAAVTPVTVADAVTAACTLGGMRKVVARAKASPFYDTLAFKAVEHIIQLTARNAATAGDVQFAEEIFLEHVDRFPESSQQQARAQLVSAIMNVYLKAGQPRKVIEMYEAMTFRQRGVVYVYVYAILAYDEVYVATGEERLASAAEMAHAEAMKHRFMYHTLLHKAIGRLWLRNREGEKVQRLMVVLQKNDVRTSMQLQRMFADILRVSGIEEQGLTKAPAMHAQVTRNVRGAQGRYF